MIHRRTIRSFLAGGLLALFALAITPKVVIHALVAHHTDTILRLDHDRTQLNTAGFHCAIDNLVVEVPFLNYALFLQLGIRPSHAIHPPVRPEAPVLTGHPLYGLRGPPSV